MSGLICLDWYDWNVGTPALANCSISSVGIELFGLIRLKLLEFLPILRFLTCRDWSVWIDTIETTSVTDLPSRIRWGRDWSVWIDTIETQTVPDWVRHSQWSGLICLDWYDWNIPINKELDCVPFVGFDLFGLIRLKLSYEKDCIFHPTFVGIDLSRFIRLKIIKGTAIEIPQ